MSAIVRVQEFLVGKSFAIPPYQRDYAWTTEQVDDLFEDIQEAMDTGSGHYLGTVVLAQTGPQSFEIVDGQQRLTTLTLIITALVKELSPADTDRIASQAILLQQGTAPKLDLGCNSQFAIALLAGTTPTPCTAGQRKLRDVYAFACDRSKALNRTGGAALIKKWIETIKLLEIIHFAAPDSGRAIRMFQTVNDRGLPLTAMDKAKALLVFYSNRYLAGELDAAVNTCFGRCFRSYDEIRESASKPGFEISNITREAFSEDDILRYHYLAYSHEDAINATDYEGSLKLVFEGFLKGTLKTLARDPARLRSFINDYIIDLGSFAESFRTLVKQSETDSRMHRDLVILGMSARLYPLAIRMQQRALLTTPIPGLSVDILQCLETCDVRVYKTRGTDPAKDVGDISHASRSAPIETIAKQIKGFVSRFMPDAMFRASLSTQDMYHNGALTLLLLAKDEQTAGSSYPLNTVAEMVRKQMTREHIFSQTPNCTIATGGFTDETDYEEHLHTFGNLTLLTKSENSKCNNKAVHTKLTDTELYAASIYAEPRALAADYSARGGVFGKTDIEQRSQEMAEFATLKWHIW